MNSLLQKKNLFIDYAFVFILVIYAGYATVFVRSSDSWENPIGLLVPIAFSLFIVFYHQVKLSRTFIYLIVGYVFYNLALTLKFGVIHPRFMGIYLISFFISYVAYSSLRTRFFIYYETILYYLCVISLIFWGIHNIIPEILGSILHQISFSSPGSGNVESNIIVYTISNATGFEGTKVNFGSFSLIRNAGFTWEAGAFASYINLAIFVNLIRTKFHLHRNKKFWILILTLITTFSTTGFSIFMLLFIFYIYNQHIKYILLFAPISIALAVYISTLPFMTEKINDVNKYNTSEMIENSITYDLNATPQRFESFRIDFIDFVNNPILGYGGHLTERWTAKLGANISTISGIGKVIAVFGLVGILFFFVSLTITSMEFAKTFRFKGWIFPFAMIIMISISYSIIFTPLLMCFWITNSNYLTNRGKMGFLIDRLKTMRLRYKTYN